MTTLAARCLACAQFSAVVAFVAACADSPVSSLRPSANSAQLVPIHARIIPNRARDATIEGLFARLDDTYGGLAGLYVDSSGTVVANVVAGSDTVAMRSAIRSELASSRKARRELIFRMVKYRYGQLRAWHDVLPQLRDAGLVMSDVDVRGDRVEFGAMDSSSVARIVDALRGIGVPSDAVHGEIRRQPVRITDLTDRVRPTVAGLQISLPKGFCTLGPSLRFPDSTGTFFFTASHCTETYFGVDGDIASQPYSSTTDTSYDHIGHEVGDPSYWYDEPYCYTGYWCRYSDAAVFKYSITSFTYGAEARTTSRSTTPGTVGSTTIAASNFSYTGLGNEADMMVGDTLDKVGRTSGWTAGVISNVCRDVYVPFTNQYLACSTVVNMTVMPGDSGSGVFLWDGNGSYNITFAGILWGADVYDHSDGNGNPVFRQGLTSNYANMMADMEFGGFAVHP
jgi:hypothetical protein